MHRDRSHSTEAHVGNSYATLVPYYPKSASTLLLRLELLIIGTSDITRNARPMINVVADLWCRRPYPTRRSFDIYICRVSRSSSPGV
eukprot:860682-Amphidinium_carterae.1